MCGNDALIAFRDESNVDAVLVARLRDASVQSSVVADLGSQCTG